MKPKLISHFEHSCVRHIDDTPFEIKPTVRKIVTQSIHPHTGRVISKCEFRTVDRVEEMKPFRLSDFYLNNLISVGAKLNPVIMQSSPLKQVDEITSRLSSIDNTHNQTNA